ncbi:hypothetical protein CONCODRAFT_6904 [Conidiobolus coronatus NRRL 28638]|uniref:Uncharacterized protein n=1 Tax=Conidiobolus coronatus (strain ATCC 28846 / CBS 209.66 / NRRL 28638) TaxID=796925 RepID=A0A137P657_CONC2|nr:hypothetical protein CONCODRAFT_6904 [Conidiobolus coronatus NRRL 28638]|eukprot:KXN70493.1 hypothetical protein CONCODRAFT_6904 [Conidiobolus coronatus NRRL 28638]
MWGLYGTLLIKVVIEFVNVVLGITYFRCLECLTFAWSQDSTSSYECLCSLGL